MEVLYFLYDWQGNTLFCNRGGAARGVFDVRKKVKDQKVRCNRAECRCFPLNICV